LCLAISSASTYESDLRAAAVVFAVEPRAASNVYSTGAGRDLDRGPGSSYMRVNHPILTEPAFLGPLNDRYLN
jgi:hypothetical protein